MINLKVYANKIIVPIRKSFFWINQTYKNLGQFAWKIMLSKAPKAEEITTSRLASVACSPISTTRDCSVETCAKRSRIDRNGTVRRLGANLPGRSGCFSDLCERRCCQRMFLFGDVKRDQHASPSHPAIKCNRRR